MLWVSTANRGGGQAAHISIRIERRWVDGIRLGYRHRERDLVVVQRWTSAHSRLGRSGSAGSRPRRLLTAPYTATIGRPINPSNSGFVNFFFFCCVSNIYTHVFVICMCVCVCVFPSSVFFFPWFSLCFVEEKRWETKEDRNFRLLILHKYFHRLQTGFWQRVFE